MQQKVINKKQHAGESLTTELQVSLENKWHQFHRNTVGLERKVEYWWKLEGMLEKENIALDLSVNPVHSVCRAPRFMAEVVWNPQSKSLIYFFEALLERW